MGEDFLVDPKRTEAVEDQRQQRSTRSDFERSKGASRDRSLGDESGGGGVRTHADTVYGPARSGVVSGADHEGKRKGNSTNTVVKRKRNTRKKLAMLVQTIFDQLGKQLDTFMNVLPISTSTYSALCAVPPPPHFRRHSKKSINEKYQPESTVLISNLAKQLITTYSLFAQ